MGTAPRGPKPSQATLPALSCCNPGVIHPLQGLSMLSWGYPSSPGGDPPSPEQPPGPTGEPLVGATSATPCTQINFPPSGDIPSAPKLIPHSQPAPLLWNLHQTPTFRANSRHQRHKCSLSDVTTSSSIRGPVSRVPLQLVTDIF